MIGVLTTDIAYQIEDDMEQCCRCRLTFMVIRRHLMLTDLICEDVEDLNGTNEENRDN